MNQLVMTALNHPLQMLCIGLVLGRTAQVFASAVVERRRARLRSGPQSGLQSGLRSGPRLAGLRRPPTAARVAM